MPRTITVYSFDELSEEVKRKVLDKFYDFNVRHDWWDNIFYDANEIGLKIEEFDLDKGTIRGELTNSVLESISVVLKNHRKDSEIRKTIKKYHKEYVKSFKKFYDGNKNNGEYEGWTVLDFLEEFDYEYESVEITKEYVYSILEDYRIILQKEYDYLTSEEAIIEAIKEDYLFKEDGTLV